MVLYNMKAAVSKGMGTGCAVGIAFPASIKVKVQSRSGKRFCHCTHLDLDDPRVGRLGARQQDSAGYVFRIEHIRLADALLRPASPESEFGLHSAGADHADLDSLGTKFFIERLGETDLRKLRRAVHRFTCEAINAGHR